MRRGNSRPLGAIDAGTAPSPPIPAVMAERPPTGNDALSARRAARKQRHRAPVQAPPDVPAPANLEPSDRGEPPPLAQRSAPTPPARSFVRDQTGEAIRRPAQLSERCATCGALSRGRTGMVTE